MSTIIGVDWGSSNRRAYRLNTEGQLLERREDDAGVLSLAGQDFGAALSSWIGDWLDTPCTVLLSGMIGSRNGWVEAPYLPVPVALEGMRQYAIPVPARLGRAEILVLPGVCQRPPAGPADVMRGEETQLLGAWRQTRADGWYVLPGTHSKWVQVAHGRIVQLHTFLTGELFARLREKGALASVAGGAADDDEGFLAGVETGRTEGALAALFSIRAGVLLDTWPAAQAASRLSGMLIGAEWAAAQQLGGLQGGHVYLIGSAGLADRYRQAARAFGAEATALPADECYVRALVG